MSEALVNSLLLPSAYPHPVDQVEFHETHISWVFVAGELAYKVKKPVDFGFVNFTTLDRRKHYCEEEVRLNSRYAPHLYLGTTPIGPATDGRQSYVIGGLPAAEYAVRMRVFSQDALLTAVLQRGELNPSHIDALAAEVAAFHSKADRAGTESRFGLTADIVQLVRDCFEPASHGLRPDDQRKLELVRDWVDEQAVCLEPVFESRRRGGFIRECHGDMHLGNMLREGDRVTLFDGIEFNEKLRWIDVISELAFTTMDLAERGRPDLSARFLNASIEHSGDYAGLRLLKFYTVYRALVRAKVASLRSGQSGIPPAELAAQRDEQRGYLALAHRLTQTARPQLLLTHGLSGSGKSYGTQMLLEQLPALRLRSDVERQRIAGSDARAASAPESGRYTRNQTDAVYMRLLEMARHVLEAGLHVIVDATFLSRLHRQQFRDLARTCGATFRILDFQAPLDVLRQRIASRAQAGRDPSEATREVLDFQLRTQDPLSPDELQEVVAVDSQRAPDWLALGIVTSRPAPR